MFLKEVVGFFDVYFRGSLIKKFVFSFGTDDDHRVVLRSISGPSSYAVSSSWWRWQGYPPHSPEQPAPEPCQWLSVYLSFPHQHCRERWWTSHCYMTKECTHKYTCNIFNPSWPAVHQCGSSEELLNSSKVVEDWPSVLWNTVVWPGGEVELGHLQLVSSSLVTLQEIMNVLKTTNMNFTHELTIDQKTNILQELVWYIVIVISYYLHTFSLLRLIEGLGVH